LLPLNSFRILDFVDILIVAIVFYKLINFIRGTKAVQLLQGLAVLVIASALSKAFGLYTVNWLLRNTMTVVLVALPVVFQPELRRTLEQLGRGKILTEPIPFLGKEEYVDSTKTSEELVQTILTLANNKTGALIVLEQKTGLQEFVETGTLVDGLVSSQLLGNIFVPNTPLHDGAVIIRENRIVAAGCFLPLTQAVVSKSLGTRHRAALGLSEETDALVFVVSEETGTISLAKSGVLKRYLEEKTIRKYLSEIYQPKNNSLSFYFKKWRENNEE